MGYVISKGKKHTSPGKSSPLGNCLMASSRLLLGHDLSLPLPGMFIDYSKQITVMFTQTQNHLHVLLLMITAGLYQSRKLCLWGIITWWSQQAMEVQPHRGKPSNILSPLPCYQGRQQALFCSPLIFISKFHTLFNLKWQGWLCTVMTSTLEANWACN